MGYVEHRISADAEVWSSPGVLGEHRVLPDGCLDLLFDGTHLLVAGPDAVARVHRSATPTPLWAVRMHGGRGAARLGVSAAELTDRLVPLEQLWGTRRSRALTDRVAEDPLRVLAAWAMAGDVDPFGLRLRALLARGASVSTAADTVGCSTRQVNRRCQDRFGYGPAHLARVLRLQRAVAGVDRGDALATVAADAGYFDQAHLTRDVRELTGLTPTALRAERVRSVQYSA